MPLSLPSAFNADGLLPVGDYELTMQELRSSMLVVGPQPAVLDWDVDHRRFLVDQLGILVDQLWQVGITDIYIDGSFARDKPHPNDIDGYFVCNRRDIASGMLQARLNQLDPYRVWTWDHSSRVAPGPGRKPELPMWHRYHVELYPHYTGGIRGAPIAFRDKFGNEYDFPSFFRQDKSSGNPKGIIRIIR